jgi:DNA-binding winged helix-turn-helix (wHTH) protein
MIYHFGECVLDTQLYSVQRGGQSIRLRPKVFRMCLYLLEHRDRVVSREELCAQLWPGRFVSPATLEGVIRSLRQALGDSGRVQGIILTRHSYGYRFVADVEEQLAGGAGVPARRSSASRDVASQGHLWSQDYAQELPGVFRLSIEIATRLAQSLKVQLRAAEKRPVNLPVQPQHTSFWRLAAGWLRGRG